MDFYGRLAARSNYAPSKAVSLPAGPPRRTGRAVFPHPAFRCSFVVSLCFPGLSASLQSPHPPPVTARRDLGLPLYATVGAIRAPQHRLSSAALLICRHVPVPCIGITAKKLDLIYPERSNIEAVTERPEYLRYSSAGDYSGKAGVLAIDLIE